MGGQEDERPAEGGRQEWWNATFDLLFKSFEPGTPLVAMLDGNGKSVAYTHIMLEPISAMRRIVAAP